METKKGKFFVFEGIDGSGKSTQTKLLAEYFHKNNYRIEKIDFPQHGEKSAGLVDEYLIGKYGPSAEVGPYRASVFYACDRYDASFKIKKWLEEGKIVISDRYLISNVGHQGGKIIENKKEWEKYIEWLYDLEYKMFAIPKPDYTFILKTSPEFSMKMSNNITDQIKLQRRLLYLGDSKKQDIHEADKNHLANTLNSYMAVAKKFPDEFKVIECLDKNKMLAPEIIHKKIVKEISKIL